MAVETHPLVRFGRKCGWGYEQTAEFFDVPYSTFKQMVRGWTGCSFRRAESFENKSAGKIRAVAVMRWHERNRREREAA